MISEASESKIELFLSKINDTTRSSLFSVYKKISKNFDLSRVKDLLFDDPKQLLDEIFDLLNKVKYKDLVKILGPVLIALGLRDLYKYAVYGTGDSWLFDGEDGPIFFKVTIATVILNIFGLVLETKFINNSKLAASGMANVMRESAKAWLRVWSFIKEGSFILAIKEFIKLIVNSHLNYMKWQYELAKTDTGYAVITVAGWLTYFLTIYYLAKITTLKGVDYVFG